VVARSRQCDEAQIAIKHDRLGFARNTGEPEARGKLALVHHPFAHEFTILRCMHDQRVEIARVSQRTPQDLRARNRARPIGERDGARRLQQADLRDLLASEAFSQRRGGQDAHAPRIARPSQQEIDHRRIVDRRIGGGIGDDGGHPSGSRRRRCGGNRLAMLGAGLADECGEIDQTGRDDIAPAIDDPHTFRQDVGADRLAHPGDHPVGNEHSAARLRQRGRVDEARIDERQRLVGHGG